MSFSSTAAIFSQTVKEQLQGLLPDYVVMTDAIGSTESGMNGIRIVQKGDAPKEGITIGAGVGRHASCSTTNFEPIEPGFGQGRARRARRQHPARLLQRSGEDRGGRSSPTPQGAVVDPRRLRDGRKLTDASRCSAAVRVSINSGGEKVYPEEVEGALKSHPDVFDVLVVGVPDERWGERVTALLQPRPGRTPTLETLQEHCRDHIAGYKVPRELLLVEEVPRLPNGKPDYRTAKLARANAPGRRRVGSHDDLPTRSLTLALARRASRAVVGAVRHGRRPRRRRPPSRRRRR